MEPFGWLTAPNLLQFLAIVVPLGTAVWVGVLRNKKHPTDEVATTAHTIETMANTISNLSQELDEERNRRRAREAALETLIDEAAKKCQEDISRLNQAHRDRVNALKDRIRVLEQEAAKRA